MEVVVGTYDPFLIGFDLLQGTDDDESYRFEPKFVDRSHAGCVKSVAVDSGGSLLASGSTDETIRLFNLKDHRELGSLHQHEGSVTCMTFFGNTHMLSASEDRTICVWECKTWDCLKTLKGHKGPVTSVSVHPSGRLAMSVSRDKHLRTWNLITGRSAYVTNIKEVATLIRWSLTGDCYAVVIANKIIIYKLATATLSYTMELPRPVLALQFLTETVLAAGGEFDGIHIFDIEKEKCLQIVTGHESRIKSLQVVEDPFTSDHQARLLLLSVSSDGDLRAWSLSPDNFEEDAQLLARYEMNGRPTCMTVSCSSTRTPTTPSADTTDGRSASESTEQPKKKKTKKRRKRPPKKKTPIKPDVHTPSKEENGSTELPSEAMNEGDVEQDDN